MRQFTLFSEISRLERLTELGDPLVKLKEVIDFEAFRPTLEKALITEAKGPGGRPPFDKVMMFKVSILQQWNKLSNESMEYQINDRLSFQRFLGLTLDDKVSDENTIRDFKEGLKRTGFADVLFEEFLLMLERENLIGREGSIVDASFIEVPKQRNNRDENKKIKNGETPDEWLKDDKKAKNKLAQKDVDARWTKKNNVSYYGYKNHI